MCYALVRVNDILFIIKLLIIWQHRVLLRTCKMLRLIDCALCERLTVNRCIWYILLVLLEYLCCMAFWFSVFNTRPLKILWMCDVYSEYLLREKFPLAVSYGVQICRLYPGSWLPSTTEQQQSKYKQILNSSLILTAANWSSCDMTDIVSDYGNYLVLHKRGYISE